MVSVFPPMYGLTPIFNVSEKTIIEIIEKGYSKVFYNKVIKTLNRYNNSIGIDEDKLPFIRLMRKRVTEIAIQKNKKVYYEDELNKTLSFLEAVAVNKNYFIKYVEEGRKLKSLKSSNYAKYKIQSITYTPFGTFKSRENKAFYKSSGVLYFDVDIPLIKKEKKAMVNFFLNDPYVRASWVSFSGKGFGFMVKSKWSNEIEMKKVYYKLLEYFNLTLQKNYNINKRVFDTQVCSLSRMNVISYGLINNKPNSLSFDFKEYSDGLFNMLHDYYKKDSRKKLPNRILTEEDYIKVTKLFDSNLKNIGKKIISDDKHGDFLEKITKSISFSGSRDYNNAIKTYVGKIFRYRVGENLIEDFLFSKIPRTKGAENNYKRLWECFSSYTQFRTVDPYFYY